MPIDWLGYAKAGASTVPKVIEGVKAVTGLRKKPDPFVILPDWTGTQQRVWTSGTIHGVKQYQLQLDLRARLENGDVVPRTVKSAGVTLSHREYGHWKTLVEDGLDWFWLTTSTPRIIQSFDDNKHNTIQVAPHSITDPYYFMARVPLPPGLVSLDRNYKATVWFDTIGGKRVSLRLPIRCPDPFINMGFTGEP